MEKVNDNPPTETPLSDALTEECSVTGNLNEIEIRRQFQMDNATYLFEGYSPDGVRPQLPHSSESFWSSIFALFLLHLAGKEEGDAHLAVWQPKTPVQPPCYYERRQGSPTINVKNVKFADIAIEPTTVTGRFFRHDLEVTIEFNFRPDILIKLTPTSPLGSPKWILVENKTVGDGLAKSQFENYLKLMKFLEQNRVDAELLLLVSVGTTDNTIYNSAKNFQTHLGARFGVLLWEDVLREMGKQAFAPGGLDTAAWARQFTNAIDRDVC
jgi:hypothetical protein